MYIIIAWNFADPSGNKEQYLIKYVKKQINKLNQEIVSQAKNKTTNNPNNEKEENNPNVDLYEKGSLMSKSSSLKCFGERRDENLEYLTKNVINKEVNKNAKFDMENLSNVPL